MSASPFNPEDVPHELKDGIVASIIGALSMTARLLLSTEKVSLGWVVRRVIAASITAVIVGYAVQDYISSPGLRLAAVGGISYASPEALDALLRWVKARAEREVQQVSQKTSNAKPKPKSSRRGKRA